jgi:hypothetical protein
LAAMDIDDRAHTVSFFVRIEMVTVSGNSSVGNGLCPVPPQKMGVLIQHSGNAAEGVPYSFPIFLDAVGFVGNQPF